MVCIDKKEDDWIFVTENTGKCDMWDLRPMLFESIEEAFEHAAVWYIEGKEENVSIVSYDEKD